MDAQGHISRVNNLHLQRNWLLPTGPIVVLFVGLVMAYCIQQMLSVPILPTIMPDSHSYLSFADHRPPGYPVFLRIYQVIFGGLSYLPQIQVGLYWTSVVLLALSVAWLTQNILSAFLIVGLGKYSPSFDWVSPCILSDCLYASLVVTGAACFVFSASTKRPSLIWLAALFFALAATTKSIGLAIFPALALSLAVLIYSREQRARTAVLAGVPIGIVLIGACAATYAHTGHFRIGSWGGMSLFGKGLMIAAPLPPNHPLSSLNWIPEETKHAQLELGRAPSLHFKILELDEYYEYLRWSPKMRGEFDRRWPRWPHARTPYDRGQLALELSIQYIANNPLAYAELVLLDYLGLWSMPRLVTKSEQVLLKQTWESMDVAFLTSAKRNVVPQAYISDVQVWVFRTISVSFGLASALVPIMLLMHRGRIAPSVIASLVLLGLSVHFSYIATAMVEAASDRFIFPTWPLMVAALTLLPYLMAPPSRRSFRPTAMVDHGVEVWSARLK
jgi:hypothetical protein